MKEKLQKNADKIHNRIILPKKFVEQHGRQYYMEVYDDQIILKPIKRGK